MTKEENERLGIVETRIDGIVADVTEIKSDVKTLIATQNQLAMNLATKEAAEKAVSDQKGAESAFRRWLAPIVITILNIAVGAVSVAVRLFGGH